MPLALFAEYPSFRKHAFKTVQRTHVTSRWSEWLFWLPAKKSRQQILLLLSLCRRSLCWHIIFHVPEKLESLPAYSQQTQCNCQRYLHNLYVELEDGT